MKIDFNKPITSPVLFMVFNRPEKTKAVFDVIKSVKPKMLYISADAPRVNIKSDYEKCKKVKEIVTNIDWECESKFLFHENNLGCSLAGVTSWDWIFESEEEMIFLEDDGVPSKSFFWFCQELLEKYRDNNRIAHICGQNFGLKHGNSSYFFTRYAGTTWGFATWKRTHKLFEYKLESYKKHKNNPEFKDKFLNNIEYKYQTKRFDDYLKKGANTYDLQHSYLLYKYDWIDIMPNINMVTNIGYDAEATNNVVSNNSRIAIKYGNLIRYEIDEIIHPEKVELNEKAEKKQLRHRVFQDKNLIRILLETYFPSILKFIKKVVR